MATKSIKQSTESNAIFAIPCTRKDAKIILTAVPWEVTTSYGSGTSLGPDAILKASPQVDLYDIEFGDPYTAGYYLDPADRFFAPTNQKLKKVAQKVIADWDKNGELSKASQSLLKTVNSGCDEMVKRVYEKTKSVLAEGRIPGLIGGDHSTPLGAIKAVSEKYKGQLGVLHVDAHADLRLAYHGFTHSHASIMRNVCNLKTPPQKLVQVGIRDFCLEEFEFIQKNEGRIHTHFDQQLKSGEFQGKSWHTLCQKIIAPLPELVYISFDIDGLSPDFCPHTGTPVPGGLSFAQATYLLSSVAKSGRKIVGFDLNEVAPDPNDPENEWDGNVGARLLFKLCGWAAVTNKLGGEILDHGT
jgi:agmatinase